MIHLWKRPNHSASAYLKGSHYCIVNVFTTCQKESPVSNTSFNFPTRHPICTNKNIISSNQNNYDFCYVVRSPYFSEINTYIIMVSMNIIPAFHGKHILCLTAIVNAVSILYNIISCIKRYLTGVKRG